MTLGFCVCGHNSTNHEMRFVNDGKCNICYCDHFITEMNVTERNKWKQDKSK